MLCSRYLPIWKDIGDLLRHENVTNISYDLFKTQTRPVKTRTRPVIPYLKLAINEPV
ncbi:hypothetical protein HanPSC8_Chr09g0362601 [Helianthus annuus]|nr:hypothetical protein HanPSC8_Chr09g0362601 [Helianthus annuus]